MDHRHGPWTWWCHQGLAKLGTWLWIMDVGPQKLDHGCGSWSWFDQSAIVDVDRKQGIVDGDRKQLWNMDVELDHKLWIVVMNHGREPEEQWS
jgi:hypothetical protein